MELVYWSVCSFSRRGGDLVKGMDGGMLILARCKIHFVSEHENFGKDTSNNISILINRLTEDRIDIP